MREIMCQKVKCKHLYIDNHMWRCNKIRNRLNNHLYMCHESDSENFIEQLNILGEYYYEKIKRECVHSELFVKLIKLRKI